MAFGFPAASVAAAAPFSPLLFPSLLFSSRLANRRQSPLLTYVDTWLHARARESTRQFSSFFVPFFSSVSLPLCARAFPPRISPVGQPFPATCTCSWNTRARATAANAFHRSCLPLNASVVAATREFSSILRHETFEKRKVYFGCKRCRLGRSSREVGFGNDELETRDDEDSEQRGI